MINKFNTFILSVVAVLTLGVVPVFAHAIVTPNQAGIAATPTFTLTVPTEKNIPTTSVRLVLPSGLNFVTPVAQSGWVATVKTRPIPSGQTPAKAMNGDVADSVATEIDWTGGSIPTGQKGLFLFSAQVPPTPGELDWKVYQGYSDGSTVSWDLGPNDPQPKDSAGNQSFDSAGPYSKTMVVNDLTGAGANSDMGSMSNFQPIVNTPNQTMALSAGDVKSLWLLAGAGLLLSVISLVLQLGKSRKV